MTRAQLLALVIADTDFASRWRERFWSKTVFEPNTGCLLWLGALNDGGYGVVTVLRRPLLASRAAMTLAVGRPPEGDALHRCALRCCVDPRHLYERTQADNNADLARVGIPGRRRTHAEVFERWRQIAEARGQGASLRELSARFSVSAPTVFRALKRAEVSQ